jgi:hypothetical protein
MRTRRVLTVTAATSAMLLALAQAASAAGGGTNQGTVGFVYNNATVSGIAFTGICAYNVNTSGLTITGQAHAVGAVTSTSITCTVKHPGGFQTSSSATTVGASTATSTVGAPPVPGIAVCITMSALSATTGLPVSASQFCV